MALDTNTINSNQEIARTVQTVRNIVNVTSGGQGTVIPPRLVGSSQVPVITRLRISPTSDTYLGTEFLLQWEDLPSEYNVDRYNIYARRLDSNEEPTVVASVNKSPVRVTIAGESTTPVVFWVQTQLFNGYSSPRELSPTAASIATIAQINGDDISSISIGKLTSGTADFTGTATFQNGNYKLIIQSNGIQITDSSAFVTINASGNIVIQRSPSRFINIASSSITLVDGTNIIDINPLSISITGGGATASLSASGLTLLAPTGGAQANLTSSALTLIGATGGAQAVLNSTSLTLTAGAANTVVSASGIQLYGGSSGVGIGASTFGSSPVRISPTSILMIIGSSSVNLSSSSASINYGGYSTTVSASVVQSTNGLGDFFEMTSTGILITLGAGKNLSINGSPGLTGSRSVMDGGGTPQTVTFVRGIITGWTT